MAEPKIQMAVIAGRIPDAVWNDLACRPTRKIVIESFKSLLTIYASVAIEKSQVFFLLSRGALNKATNGRFKQGHFA